MSISNVQSSLCHPIVKSSHVHRGRGRPRKGPLSEEAKIRDGSIQKIRQKVWTPRDESLLEEAVTRSLRANGKVSFAKLGKDPELAKLGTRKQLSAKWHTKLSTYSLGGVIEDKAHRKVIEGLYEEHPKKWAEISRLFADKVLSGKPKDKSYPGSVIKNYFSSSTYRRRKSNRSRTPSGEDKSIESVQEKKEEGKSSSVTSVESQDKVPSFDELFLIGDRAEMDFDGGLIPLSELEKEIPFLRQGSVPSL